MGFKTITFIILVLISLSVLFLKYSNSFNVLILNIIIVMRGILQPNCFWWKISELFLKDSSGIKLYNKYKKSNGDFSLTTMFNKKIYIVTNNKYIKTILNNSPHVFGVGSLKFRFFKSFMSKNVGVSQGCPWKRRRKLNEQVLITDRIHVFSKKYDHDINILLFKNIHRHYFNFKIFTEVGKQMVSKIVFNENRIDEDVFSIFSSANSISAFYNTNFKIDSKIFYKYNAFLKKHIRNPNKKSLVKLCTQYELNEQEILLFYLTSKFFTSPDDLLSGLFRRRHALKRCH